MQVILDSSFARPGSAPIWGGKKGEFRNWTRSLDASETGESTKCPWVGTGILYSPQFCSHQETKMADPSDLTIVIYDLTEK